MLKRIQTILLGLLLCLFGAVGQGHGQELKILSVTAANQSQLPVLPEGYTGYAVTIPGSVTGIDRNAFLDCSSLTSVTIPDSVTSIGHGAFQRCSSLTSIEAGKGNTKYTSEDGVLFNKDKTEIILFAGGRSGHYTIGNSVTSIGPYAFQGCSSLTSVTIPDSVTTIGTVAFQGCSSLTSVTIPDSVTTINFRGRGQSSSTFSGCSSLTSVTIGNSVTMIGSHAFADCSSLTSVTIGNSVIKISLPNFRDSRSLTSIEVGKGNTQYSSMDGVLFDKNKTLLIQIPAGKSGHYTIPDSVTSIRSSAFKRCSSLTSVTIPDSVTSIGKYAFQGCSSLTSVTIPDSVTSIGAFAFDNCSSLTSVTIPDGVTGIWGHTFSNCSSLTSVTIPDSVTTIWWNAFQGCSSLESVTIPDSVSTIGKYAFQGCSSLTRLVFGGNAPAIGLDVFAGVSGNAKVFINPDAIGFGETFEGLPLIIQEKIEINSFNNLAAPFSLTLETKSDSTYKIEASHDLKQWGEIGEVQGTGSSVKFTDWREALFQKQYYRLKLVE